MIHNGPVAFTAEIFVREVEYAFDSIKIAQDNESAWNYLRGLLQQTPLDVAGADVRSEIFSRYLCSDAYLMLIITLISPQMKIKSSMQRG